MRLYPEIDDNGDDGYPLHRLIEEMPAAEYHAIDCASRSRLVKLAEGKTPRKVQHDFAHPAPSTPAQKLGTEVHTLVLEPWEFDEQYVKAMDRPRRTKADKEAWAEFEKVHAGKEVLKIERWDQLHGIRDALWDHPRMRALSLDFHYTEPTFFVAQPIWNEDWQWEQEDVEPEGWLLCRCRMDFYDPATHTILDLKTTQDASLDAFERQIRARRYHLQAGAYCTWAKLAGIEVEHFVIVAVETKPPYEVAVRRMRSEVVQHGWESMWPHLRTMYACYRDDEWPSYGDTIEDIGLPEYDMRRIWDNMDAV